MELTYKFLVIFASITATLTQQDSQIALQGVQQAPQGRSAPLLGVRYSAATDVSHVSFSSPLVTYGSSLNEIQLPAAPIQPASLRQAPQENNQEGGSQGDQGQTLIRSFSNQAQSQSQAQQNQLQQQATQPQAPANQQFISVQQYPARPQLQATPQGFSLNQNLPGPQPQAVTSVRYAPQYPTAQTQPQVQQPQYVTAQQQYSQPQPQQYALPQLQQQQYTLPQPQQQQYTLPQPQAQYPSPVAYSSPSSNAYFATGPFAAQSPAPYAQPAAAAQYVQQVPAQYAQPVAQQYAQPLPAQYAQPTVALGPQYAAQSALPSAPAQFVSRVAFNGPVGGFSYGF